MSIFKLFRSSSEAEQKRKSAQEAEADQQLPVEESESSGSEEQPAVQASVTTPQKKGFFGKLKRGLAKTRAKLGSGLADILLGKKVIDDELIDDIEMQLLTADVGVEATETVMESVRASVSRNELQTTDQLTALIKQKLNEILAPVRSPLVIDNTKKPYVILVAGINGVGKTTTIGKLAKKFQDEGKSVMLAAGDTFRAAAIEQLQAWGAQNEIPVVAQHKGADSASVLYDAVNAARSRQADVLIADTAGRLHTKTNLMDELKKVNRVIKKIDPEAPHETLLVLDAGTGQNALMQTAQFQEAIGVSGLVLTKMDGTAKGGIIFAIARQYGIPIRYIGVGESIDDLQPFEADQFVDALFDTG